MLVCSAAKIVLAGQEKYQKNFWRSAIHGSCGCRLGPAQPMHGSDCTLTSFLGWRQSTSKKDPNYKSKAMHASMKNIVAQVDGKFEAVQQPRL